MDDGNGGNIINEIAKASQEYWIYLWMVILGIWGGTVSYLAKIQKEDRKFRSIELIAQWITSSFTGIIGGYIVLSATENIWIVFAIAGLSGHAGAGAIKLFERWARDNLSMFGSDNEKGDKGSQ